MVMFSGDYSKEFLGIDLEEEEKGLTSKDDQINLLKYFKRYYKRLSTHYSKLTKKVED
jgi:hypothetical protein